MIKLIKALESDKNFLLNLRKETMSVYLEDLWIFLNDDEHLERINSNFESAFIINIDNKQIWLIKYINLENYIEIIQFQILESFQWKWIWKKVLNILLWFSKKLNKKLYLKVLKNNPAINLYKKLWFTLIWEDKIEFFMERKV